MADNVAITWRWFDEVWNKGRLEAIDEMASPDAVGHGQGQHGIDIGLKEFRPFVRSLRTAFPDIHISIHDTVAQDDKVVMRWTAAATHNGPFLGIAPTGRKIRFTGTSIQRIVDGKIVEGWDNWDQLGLLVQIGVVNAAHFIPVKDSPQSKAS